MDRHDRFEVWELHRSDRAHAPSLSKGARCLAGAQRSTAKTGRGIDGDTARPGALAVLRSETAPGDRPAPRRQNAIHIGDGATKGVSQIVSVGEQTAVSGKGMSGCRPTNSCPSARVRLASPPPSWFSTPPPICAYHDYPPSIHLSPPNPSLPTLDIGSPMGRLQPSATTSNTPSQTIIGASSPEA